MKTKIEEKWDSPSLSYEDSKTILILPVLSLMIYLSELFFRPLLSDPPLAVRDVRGHDLGRLITMRGIVTRISEVKPLMAVICYSCDSCGADVFQDIANKQFTPLTDCISDDCLRDNRKGTLHMQTRACRFRPFQEVKFQEMVSSLLRRTFVI